MVCLLVERVLQKDMEGLNGTPISSSGNARKLLVGELVEVRQKEKGLRGSWHPGVVVKVKYGRRVVEYDELLTLDGLNKLRETIALPEDVKFQSSALRERNGLQAVQERNSRGFLRPRPPPCLLFPSQNWTKGLLVDAFHEDAWWEGILLDDVVSSDGNIKVRIFFPEEGDELRVLVRNMRVSQEWDEATGHWTVRGHWASLSSEGGGLDFSPLKQIWRQRRSSWKEMWRQKRYTGREDAWKEEERTSFSSPLLQAEQDEARENGGPYTCANVDQDRQILKQEERSTALSNNIVLVALQVQQALERNTSLCSEDLVLASTDEVFEEVQAVSAQNDHPAGSGAGETEHCLVENRQEKENMQILVWNEQALSGAKKTCDPILLSTPADQGIISESLLHTPVVSAEQVDGSSVPVSLSETPKSWSQAPMVSSATFGKSSRGDKRKLWGQFLENKSRSHCISRLGQGSHSRRTKTNPTKIAKARLTRMGKTEARLTRNRGGLEVSYQSSGKHLRSNTSQLLKGHSLHGMPGDKLAVATEGFGSENTSNGKQARKRDSDITRSTGIGVARETDCNCEGDSGSLYSQQGACHRGRGIITKMQPNNSSVDVVPFGGEASPLKKMIKQARLSAKKILLDAGWHIEFRQRPHKAREAVYVSPGGSRYFSLASACRGWKKCQNMSISNGECESVEVKLLDTYNIAEGLMCLKKPSTRQMKAEQMISSVSSGGSMGGKIILDSSHRNSPSIIKRGRFKTPPSTNSSLTIVQDMPAAEILKDSNCADEPLDHKDSGTFNHKRRLSTGRQQEMGFEGLSNFIDDATVQEPRFKRSRLSPCVEKGKKRKQIVQDSCFSNEPRCKKSKSASKKAGSLQDSKGGRARGGCRMQVLLSLPGKDRDSSSIQESVEPSHLKKRTVLSWLIDMGLLKENETVCYVNRKDGHVMKEGQVAREGVLCKCCKDVFTLSNFEAHAGSKLHRPSANIFLNDGRSISECQMQAWALQEAREKKESILDSSDDTCGVCGDGGELILCDHCPSTFHADCIGLEVIPEGDWYCPRCCCGVCGGNQLAGDVDKTMIRCAQCELEYHLACVHAHGMLKSERSRKNWFCGHRCEEIFTDLRGLVGIANPLEKGLSWTLVRSMEEDQGITPSNLEVMAEHNSKLSVAHGVMQECFVPMIDPRTKIDLLSQALYNRRSKVTRLNYGGFYTMLLESGDELISVATIRVHGSKLAEMPLVGTRYQYRRQGMCRRLMRALEEMLKKIGVEKLILPAVPELLETWMGPFNFQHMSSSERCELTKLNLMSFPGTTLLQKHLTTDHQGSSEAQFKEPQCQPAVTEMVDNVASPSCKSERDSIDLLSVGKQMAISGSLGEGVMNYHKACQTEQSNAPVERNTHICAVEEGALIDQNLQSGFLRAGFNQHTGGSLILMQDTLHTPAVGELTEGQTKTSLGRGRVKGRNKYKPQIERPGASSGIGPESKDDDFYNTKVVLTTTRSKRLVKSSRWVADGLKELSKDAKHSRRALGMEGNFPKTSLPTCRELTQDSKSAPFIGEAGSRDDGQGDGPTLGNVYIRTRRRTVQQFVQLEECKQLRRILDFSASNKTCKNAWESQHPEACECREDATNSTLTDTQQMMCPISSSSPNIHESTSTAERSVLNTGFRENSDGSHSLLDANRGISIQADNEGVLVSTKYYSRRRKQKETAVDTVGSFPLVRPSFTTLIGDAAVQLNIQKINIQEQVEQGQNPELTLKVFGATSSSCAAADSVSATVEGQVFMGQTKDAESSAKSLEVAQIGGCLKERWIPGRISAHVTSGMITLDTREDKNSGQAETPNECRPEFFSQASPQERTKAGNSHVLREATVADASQRSKNDRNSIPTSHGRYALQHNKISSNCVELDRTGDPAVNGFLCASAVEISDCLQGSLQSGQQIIV